MNVWTYWEGRKERYVDLCLATIRRACGADAIVVTPESLGKYVSLATDLHDNYARLARPAERADCVRAVLLANHGGWWVDADTVLEIHPEKVNEQYSDAECLYMTWSRQPCRVLNGCIYMERNSSLGRHWLDNVNRVLAERSWEIWGSLGERVLTPLVCGRSRAVEIPRATFFPVDVDRDVEAFFRPGFPSEYSMPCTIGFGLNNSYMLYHHADLMRLPERDWPESDLLIHRLLQYAKERLA